MLRFYHILFSKLATSGSWSLFWALEGSRNLGFWRLSPKCLGPSCVLGPSWVPPWALGPESLGPGSLLGPGFLPGPGMGVWWSMSPGPLRCGKAWSLVPGPWVPAPWSHVPGPRSQIPGPRSLVPGCFVMNEVFWRCGEVSAILPKSATRDLQF